MSAELGQIGFFVCSRVPLYLLNNNSPDSLKFWVLSNSEMTQITQMGKKYLDWHLLH